MTMVELRAGPALAPGTYEALLERAVLERYKWNLTAGDTPTLCRFPILMSPRGFGRLARQAEALAHEALAAEGELLSRPELVRRLGLSRRLVRLLPRGGRSEAPRFLRVDFHPTVLGDRITEINSDVAGGFVDGSGVTSLWAELGLGRPAGDPAGAVCEALVARFGPGARVGLLHLTQYTDDRQVAAYLGQRFEASGLRVLPFSPTQLRPGLRARVGEAEYALDAVLRFFPGEWLEKLPEDTGWQELVASRAVSNPVTAMLTDSKRFPVVWPALETPLPTWRELLPETRSPETVASRAQGWVLKPAFGHEGSGVSLEGVASAVSQAADRGARRTPGRWVAQRRFEHSALKTPDGLRFVCLGVYVVDGRASGAYARVASTPLIDGNAQDAVVLLED